MTDANCAVPSYLRSREEQEAAWNRKIPVQSRAVLLTLGWLQWSHGPGTTITAFDLYNAVRERHRVMFQDIEGLQYDHMIAAMKQKLMLITVDDDFIDFGPYAPTMYQPTDDSRASQFFDKQLDLPHVEPTAPVVPVVFTPRSTP